MSQHFRFQHLNFPKLGAFDIRNVRQFGLDLGPILEILEYFFRILGQFLKSWSIFEDSWGNSKFKNI